MLQFWSLQDGFLQGKEQHMSVLHLLFSHMECMFLLNSLADTSLTCQMFSRLQNIGVCSLGRIENQNFWIFSIPQVGPMDAHKNKHIY